MLLQAIAFADAPLNQVSVYRLFEGAGRNGYQNLSGSCICREIDDLKGEQIKIGTLSEAFLNLFFARKPFAVGFRAQLLTGRAILLLRERLCSAFVRNGQALSTVFSAVGQYPAAVGGSHAFAEAVLILSFSFGRLVRAFHAFTIFD